MSLADPANFRLFLTFTFETVPITIAPSERDQGNLRLIGLPNGTPNLARFQPNPFLNQLKGIYLGHRTPIQFQINNDWVYLNQIRMDEIGGIYQMSNTPDNTTTAIEILEPGANWGRFPASDVRLFNINPITSQAMSPGSFTGIILNPVNTMSGNRLVYSVTECTQNNSCGQCGDIGCPEGFMCGTGGVCMDGMGRLAMGFRGPAATPGGGTLIATYTVHTNNTLIDVRFPGSTDFTASDTDMRNFREKWFLVDNIGPTELFQVGQDYPLYIEVNGEKRYLTNPRPGGTGGDPFTRYDLASGTTAPSGAATFKPTRTGNWRVASFTQSDFQDFTLPQFAGEPIRNIALWQNHARQGRVAVRRVSPPNGNGGRGGNGGGGNGGSGNKQTPRPFWKEWWFWLLIVAILLLVFIGGFLLYRSHHRTSKTG